jgi:RNA polymerase sigma factor (sigma-70 family)
MPGTFLPTVLRHLRQLLGGEAEGVSDGQLLERFVASQEESAFATLMQRHGGMVLGVCRRHLDTHDAEDVFQATFLVLVKKAMSIRKQQSVGSWLHGVAYRLAAKARGQACERRRHEKEAADMRTTEAPPPDIAWRELQHILDEELERLPERYRLPLVHCYLEEQTHEEAAAALGWRVGTVKSRLARGKERLRAGLARRGLTLSVPALTATLAVNGSAAAGIPTALAQTTAHAATLAGTGKALLGAVSDRVLALMEGAAVAMAGSKLKLAVFAVVFLGLLAGGGTVMVRGWGDEVNSGVEDVKPEKQAENRPTVKGGVNADLAKRAWISLIKAKLVAVEVEPCLYEVKDEKRFLMALRLTNLSKTEIGIDWSDRKRALYPNQWGVHDAKVREIVNERRTIHPAPDQDKVKADFNAGKLTRIAAGKATVVFTEFNNSGRAQVDAAKGKYLIISMDGLFCATDGKAVDVISCTWDKAHRPQETDVVMPFPVRWKVKKPADPLDDLPVGIGVKSWHWFTQADEIRISWFSKPPDIAQTCWVNLSTGKVSQDIFVEGKEIKQGVRVSSARWHSLSEGQKKTLQKLVLALPASHKGLDLKNAVLITVNEKGEVNTYLYDRTALPAEIQRLVDLTGADLDTPAEKK